MRVMKLLESLPAGAGPKGQFGGAPTLLLSTSLLFVLRWKTQSSLQTHTEQQKAQRHNAGETAAASAGCAGTDCPRPEGLAAGRQHQRQRGSEHTVTLETGQEKPRRDRRGRLRVM